MGELSVIERGSIAISEGKVAWVGKQSELKDAVTVRKGGLVEEFGGGVALPGLVDAHTHLVFAGDRSDEVSRKIHGESYLDIARSGGGLMKTVLRTRQASKEMLYTEAKTRLDRMVRWGTTSLEAKSGYGLNLTTEMKLLEVASRLGRDGLATVVPTFLGAHAYPPEYEGRHPAYVKDLVEKQIPAVSRAGIARFCDVFCEEGFFSASDSKKILEAGAMAGLKPKIHADEFTDSGGAEVAASVGAASADHLLMTGPKGLEVMRKKNVTAVLLPVTPFASLSGERSKGREFVDAGVPVALGSDICPNSWVEGMPFVMSHAVYSAHLTPREAVTAATVNAAHAIGLGGAGRIFPGGRADIAIFDLPSVEHLAYRSGILPPVAVYIAGRIQTAA